MPVASLLAMVARSSRNAAVYECAVPSRVRVQTSPIAGAPPNPTMTCGAATVEAVAPWVEIASEAVTWRLSLRLIVIDLAVESKADAYVPDGGSSARAAPMVARVSLALTVYG